MTAPHCSTWQAGRKEAYQLTPVDTSATMTPSAASMAHLHAHFTLSMLPRANHQLLSALRAVTSVVIMNAPAPAMDELGLAEALQSKNLAVWLQRSACRSR
jgi:hypothetical protein